MKKTRRCSRRKNDGFGRISSLPDGVLAHILSFVTTKDAVQTCILSKRWKDVLAFVPVLGIGYRDFSFDLISEEHEQLCAGVYGEDHEFITPSSINLPYLESLILGFVTVRDDFVEKLLTGCPLEELVLSDCSMQITDIRSDKLKNLVLGGWSTDFCTQPQVFEY